MIKYSILYPTDGGTTFDHDYYRTQHMPLVARLLGDACDHYEISTGVAGAAPGSPPTYVCLCDIFCESEERFRAAISPHLQEIQGDLGNYTDIVPVAQISQVVAS